mgnify:FL=1|jgi:hypothetical protein
MRLNRHSTACIGARPARPARPAAPATPTLYRKTERRRALLERLPQSLHDPDPHASGVRACAVHAVDVVAHARLACELQLGE